MCVPVEKLAVWEGLLFITVGSGTDDSVARNKGLLESSSFLSRFEQKVMCA